MVIEGYETAGEAAERLGITHKYLVQLAARGLIPGAKQVDAGRRYWYVPVDCDPLYRPPEGYELTADAAKRMGLSQNRLIHVLAEGKVAGARRVRVGGRTIWLVPIGSLPPARTIRTQRVDAYSRPMRHPARCDCCGIILTRSGDDKHPNDAPDAVRCWSCREEYGLGPLMPRIVNGGDACTPTGGFTRLQQRCAAGPV